MISSSVYAPYMIGRQTQLDEVKRHLYAAQRGDGRVILIGGEAGVGKTRLLNEFVKQARAEGGVALLAGRCYDEEPALPYGPFIDVIRACIREQGIDAVAAAAGPWLSDLARLVPELASLAPATSNSDDPQAQKRRLFEAICRVICPISPDTCRIVMLEDIHWSDQTSQELIRYLARAIEHERVLLLATYRTDELHRRHPLTQLIASLTRERLHVEARIEPLSRDELREMLEAMMGHVVPHHFVDAINGHSEGNPFFVEEIVKSLIEHEQLDTLIERVQEGKSIDHIAIPTSIKASILNRIAAFDDSICDVLYYAAIVGRRFGFDLLLRLTGMDETELLRSIDQLVSSQIVVEEPDEGEDHYRFRHALIREAIYDDMLSRERRIKHREVLRVLEESGSMPCEVDQLAHHAYQARELDKAGRYARLAAERAQGMYAYREAVNRYQLALELLDNHEPDERADMLHQLALAAYALGDTKIAMRSWQEARQLYEQSGRWLRAGDMGLHLARIQWESSDVSAAFETLNAALAVLEKEPPGSELGMAYSTYSHLYMVLDRHQECLDWGEKALRLANDLGDEVIQAHALNNMGCSLAGLGDGEQGVARLQRSLDLSKKHHMTMDAMRSYLNLGSTLAGVGKISEAREVLTEGIAFARKYGLEVYIGMLLSKLGLIELELGHWQLAEELIAEVLTSSSQREATYWYASSIRAELLLRQGHTEQALEAAERILRHTDAERDSYQTQSVLSVLMRASYLLGDMANAARTLEQWHNEWLSYGLINKLRACAADAVEIALASGQTALAHAMVAHLGTPIESVCDYGWLVPLPHEDAHGIIASYEGRHSQAATHFGKAAAFWQQQGLSYYQGRSLRRKAWNLFQSGNVRDRQEALGDLAEAQALFSSLGAAFELAQVAELTQRYGETVRPARQARTDGLTPREQQVIALVARGYSNRAIAETLVISEKTAEVHVSNILGKLGFSSRTQAAAYAVEQQMAGR